jgi:hypothetical protein
VVAVPEYVSANARRGLDLLEYAGAGLRPKTIREARQMAQGTVSPNKVMRMAAWFARHKSDLQNEDANAYVRGEKERPTAGQVAWLLWGGDLGDNRMRAMDWAERKRDSLIESGELDKAAGDKITRGSAVQYAVPKPPGPTQYATGIVVSVARVGTVTVGNEKREASSDDPAAIVRVYARNDDRLVETDRRVVRLFSELRTIEDISDRIDKEVTGPAARRIATLVEEHNAKHGDKAGKRITRRMLEAVYERGIGAYRTNPGSVRPNVTSAEQWAYGRVNAFLTAVRTGRFPRTAFDTDLLPKDHPLSSKKD